MIESAPNPVREQAADPRKSVGTLFHERLSAFQNGELPGDVVRYGSLHVEREIAQRFEDIRTWAADVPQARAAIEELERAPKPVYLVHGPTDAACTELRADRAVLFHRSGFGVIHGSGAMSEASALVHECGHLNYSMKYPIAARFLRQTFDPDFEIAEERRNILELEHPVCRAKNEGIRMTYHPAAAFPTDAVDALPKDNVTIDELRKLTAAMHEPDSIESESSDDDLEPANSDARSGATIADVIAKMRIFEIDEKAGVYPQDDRSRYIRNRQTDFMIMVLMNDAQRISSDTRSLLVRHARINAERILEYQEADIPTDPQILKVKYADHDLRAQLIRRRLEKEAPAIYDPAPRYHEPEASDRTMRNILRYPDQGD